MGQPFALPATSPFFLSSLPRAVAPNGGPPPAHSGGALSALHVDPTKIGSPTYTSPYFPSTGYSPSFELPPFTPNLARFSPMPSLLQGAAASPAQFSPIHSPSTGTPIVPCVPKPADIQGQAQQLRLYQDMLNLARSQHVQAAAVANAASNVSLPPSLNFRVINASPFSGHPLQSMASLKLPNVTTTPQSLATSLASQPTNGMMAGHNQLLRRSGNDRLLPGKIQNGRKSEDEKNKLSHIKKPLNAFMLFMKENRTKLMEEKGYKERQSAELNKELGRLWHTLTHEDQQKYYQMAKEERQKHLQLYPGWSARDNYAVHKKKKRKRDKTMGDDNLELKKCRARFGLDQQVKWCKHCRRKKKCLWFREGGPSGSSNQPNSQPAGAGPGSSEQSPVQVSSTTHGHGSPLDAEAVVNGALGITKDGQPPAKIARGSTSSDVSSPSAVSSTTKMARESDVSGVKMTSSDVSDDEDDVSDEEGGYDSSSPIDFSIEELEEEEKELGKQALSALIGSAEQRGGAMTSSMTSSASQAQVGGPMTSSGPSLIGQERTMSAIIKEETKRATPTSASHVTVGVPPTAATA